MWIFLLDLVPVLLLCFSGVLYARRKKATCPLPPGPKGLLIVGNVLDIPKTREWITYEKWGKEFGSDIIHMEVFGTHLIVLNSAKAAKELFERRSSLYSDRPRLIALNIILHFDWTLAFLRYGPRWRNMRREFHRYFHPTAARQYHPIERDAAHELLRRLMDTPTNFSSHIRHMAGQIIIKIAYGIDVRPKDDPYVDAAEDAMKAFAFGSTPQAELLDTFPLLARLPAWIPGNSFRREAEVWAMCAPRGIEKPYRAVKEDIINGAANPSVTAQMIQQQCAGEAPSYLDEDAVMHTTGSMYLAGADTTVSDLQTFFLAMVLHPEAQRKAQDELDRVVGTDRLPDFTDEPALPYVTALMKEVLRWRPVGPLSIPHRVVCDDIYSGYLIPAGSIVIGNAWAILHDEVAFPEPERFRPERFLTIGPSDMNNPFPEAVFGFGRRICPGRYMARSAMWIAIASILATCEISKALDEKGHEVGPIDEYTSGIISYPIPFQCRILPRPSAMEQLVRG